MQAAQPEGMDGTQRSQQLLIRIVLSRMGEVFPWQRLLPQRNPV